MAIRQLTSFNDEKFRKKSREIIKFDERLGQLLDDMLDTLRYVQGYGCAAVHVGVLKRVVLIDGDNGDLMELVNPTITETSQETQQVFEGSISTGSPWAYVNRPIFLSVSAFNRWGQPISVKADGFLAATLMHEIEHLDGILFTDRATQIVTDVEEVRHILSKINR